MLDLRSIKLAWTFALREMRSGLAGFRVFLACIAIGVAAIGAVNSVATGINNGIEAEGKEHSRRRSALRTGAAHGQ